MRARVVRTALAASLAAALLPGAAGAATPDPPPPDLEIAIADERPLRGEAVRLTLTAGGAPAAGAAVEAVYRPNSSTSYREALPPADSTGTIFWIPRDAGPVALEARPAAALADPPTARHTVAVRYPGFPPSGLAIMLLAGALLLGGATLGFVMLLTGPRAVVPVDEPPST